MAGALSYNLALVERATIEAALAEAGSLATAAQLLGVTRHSLRRRLQKYGLQWEPRGGRLVPVSRAVG